MEFLIKNTITKYFLNTLLSRYSLKFHYYYFTPLNFDVYNLCALSLVSKSNMSLQHALIQSAWILNYFLNLPVIQVASMNNVTNGSWWTNYQQKLCLHLQLSPATGHPLLLPLTERFQLLLCFKPGTCAHAEAQIHSLVSSTHEEQQWDGRHRDCAISCFLFSITLPCYSPFHVFLLTEEYSSSLQSSTSQDVLLLKWCDIQQS